MIRNTTSAILGLIFVACGLKHSTPKPSKVDIFSIQDDQKLCRLISSLSGSDSVWKQYKSHWQTGEDDFRLFAFPRTSKKGVCYARALYVIVDDRGVLLAGESCTVSRERYFSIPEEDTACSNLDPITKYFRLNSQIDEDKLLWIYRAARIIHDLGPHVRTLPSGVRAVLGPESIDIREFQKIGELDLHSFEEYKPGSSSPAFWYRRRPDAPGFLLTFCRRKVLSCGDLMLEVLLTFISEKEVEIEVGLMLAGRNTVWNSIESAKNEPNHFVVTSYAPCV